MRERREWKRIKENERKEEREKNKGEWEKGGKGKE